MGWDRRERESHWRSVLERQAISGMSVAEFCRRESISAPALYAWRRKLGRATASSRDEGQSPGRQGRRRLRLASTAEEGSGARLLPVRIESRGSASVRILLPGSVCVEAPCGMNPTALVEVVRALREVSPC